MNRMFISLRCLLNTSPLMKNPFFIVIFQLSRGCIKIFLGRNLEVEIDIRHSFYGVWIEYQKWSIGLGKSGYWSRATVSLFHEAAACTWNNYYWHPYPIWFQNVGLPGRYLIIVIITKLLLLLSSAEVITEQIQISIVPTASIIKQALVKYIMLFGLSYNIGIITLVPVRVAAGKEFHSDDSIEEILMRQLQRRAQG